MTPLTHTRTPLVPPAGGRSRRGVGYVRVCGKEKDHPSTVVLTLADTGEGPPFDVRLARLLKVALRTFGLKCTDVRRHGQDDDSSSVASGRSRGREVSAAPAATSCGGGFHDGGGGQ